MAPSIPVLQDIKAYIQENGLSVDAEQFYDYYTARGWMLSGTQIVDWTALLRNWERAGVGEHSYKTTEQTKH